LNKRGDAFLWMYQACVTSTHEMVERRAPAILEEIFTGLSEIILWSWTFPSSIDDPAALLLADLGCICQITSTLSCCEMISTGIKLQLRFILSRARGYNPCTQR